MLSSSALLQAATSSPLPVCRMPRRMPRRQTQVSFDIQLIDAGGSVLGNTLNSLTYWPSSYGPVGTMSSG